MRTDSRTPSIAVLQRRRQKLLGEAASLRLLIGGSWFERFSTCSRPQCACHQGQRHGPRTYVVVTQEKAQRQHYVPQDQVQALKKGIRQYRRLLEIVGEVTRINLALMRRKALQKNG
ncbi:MAG: DUF6788 family protein [Acidobacteriota bacterium]